ncbi:hypothetical protein ANO11243_006240 [Dothideomycetidae sp. 11243]|nr:hypothetical protein ANO11243_006240 [fungal sp. No.11243]
MYRQDLLSEIDIPLLNVIDLDQAIKVVCRGRRNKPQERRRGVPFTSPFHPPTNPPLPDSMALNEVPLTRRAQLRARAISFSDSFAAPASNPPSSILDKHFTSSPRITEHGPKWAQSSRLPFLGRTFSGREGCLEYFSLLAETLEFLVEDAVFPSKMEVVVDPEAVGPEDKADAWGNGSGVVMMQCK